MWAEICGGDHFSYFFIPHQNINICTYTEINNNNNNVCDLIFS